MRLGLRTVLAAVYAPRVYSGSAKKQPKKFLSYALLNVDSRYMIHEKASAGRQKLSLRLVTVVVFLLKQKKKSFCLFFFEHKLRKLLRTKFIFLR